MDGEDYRILWLSLICALTCLVGIAVGLRLLVQNAIATITATASHKQLLLDAENLCLGFFHNSYFCDEVDAAEDDMSLR